MANTAGKGVEEEIGETLQQFSVVVQALFQGRVNPFRQHRVYRYESSALTGVTEDLRAGDQLNAVMGVMSYRRLIGLRVRVTAVRITEVHIQIREVLQHDGVILRCQLADYAQLLVRETRPGGVIGVTEQDSGYTAALQVPLQLLTQFVPSEIGYVERIYPAADH